jgi:hypothetical protein
MKGFIRERGPRNFQLKIDVGRDGLSIIRFMEASAKPRGSLLS